MSKIPITVEGHNKLQIELKQLINEERPNIIKAIAEARSHGDLSENAEYHSAKEKQSFIEGKIAELESVIAQADIIDVSTLSGKDIKFGATVTVIDEETEQRVMSNLKDSMKGKTLIFITHRIATLNYCNRIFNVANGRVQEISKNDLL